MSRCLLRLNSRPNPVLSSTLIEYQLPVAGNVKLSIYNIAGQLVKTLIHAGQSAGTHAIRWNGDDDRGQHVSAGAYFCKLRAGGTSVTKRLVLIR